MNLDNLVKYKIPTQIDEGQQLAREVHATFELAKAIERSMLPVSGNGIVYVTSNINPQIVILSMQNFFSSHPPSFHQEGPSTLTGRVLPTRCPIEVGGFQAYGL